MSTSEERAVAKLAADILAQANIPGINQVVLEGDDADLKLPAIVVSARYQEIEWALKKNNIYGGRYRLEPELRGLRTKPGTAGLDAMLAAISVALETMPNPVPASGAPFVYYLIEKWESAETEAGDETRRFKRTYTVFALFN